MSDTPTRPRIGRPLKYTYPAAGKSIKLPELPADVWHLYEAAKNYGRAHGMWYEKKGGRLYGHVRAVETDAKTA